MNFSRKIYSLVKQGYKKIIQRQPVVQKVWISIHVRLINHPVYTRWQITRAQKTYEASIKGFWKTSEKPNFSHKLCPMVTFLLPCADSGDEYQITLDSIANQRYPFYELVLPRSVSERFDPPINHLVNLEGSAAHYLDLLPHANGDYVVLVQPGDIFHPDYLNHMIQCLNEHPDAEIVYAEGFSRGEDGTIVNPYFNPDTWSPTLMLSNNMLRRSMVSRSLAQQNIQVTACVQNLTAQEWAFMLACGPCAKSIKHAAEVIFNVLDESAISEAGETEKIIRSTLIARGLSDIRVTRGRSGRKITWMSRQPKISIIIPSKDKYAVLHRAIESIYSKTEYPDYEIIIVDNHSTQAETLQYYRELESRGGARIIPFPEKFNYSRAINIGASQANGELLCLLNNDIEVIEPDWLNELARWALLPDVGVVGARLLFPNQTIQHAGIILGMLGFVGHLYMHAPENYFGLLGSVNWYRDLSAVTGACQMMSKEVFNRMGGYNENYVLTFSDVEFCLKAREAGLRVIYTPHACLYHWEGKTRGNQVPQADITQGRTNFLGASNIFDPFYSKRLSRHNIPILHDDDPGQPTWL